MGFIDWKIQNAIKTKLSKKTSPDWNQLYYQNKVKTAERGWRTIVGESIYNLENNC